MMSKKKPPESEIETGRDESDFQVEVVGSNPADPTICRSQSFFKKSKYQTDTASAHR
jgi:hypothetical protein